MGFLKRLFKRKKRGTFFGNLIRGVANKATGGILGNGRGLQKWEERQAQKVRYTTPPFSPYQAGQNVGTSIKGHISNMPQVKQVQDEMKKNWLKENWWKIALGVVGVAGLTYMVATRGKKKSGKW